MREADVLGVEEAEGWYTLWVESDKMRFFTFLTLLGRRRGRLPALFLEVRGIMFSLQCEEGNFLHPNTALSLDQKTLLVWQSLARHLGAEKKKLQKSWIQHSSVRKDLSKGSFPALYFL